MTPVSQPPTLAFADQLGFFFEATGHPRLAGRVLGWLLVCDPPHQSAQDLAAILGVSRSGISPITQALVRQGFIEPVRVPGVREVHFRVAEEGWVRMQRESFTHLVAVRKMAERTLDQLSERSPSTNLRLRTLVDFHRFLEREVPALLDRWEQESAKNARNS